MSELLMALAFIKDRGRGDGRISANKILGRRETQSGGSVQRAPIGYLLIDSGQVLVVAGHRSSERFALGHLTSLIQEMGERKHVLPALHVVAAMRAKTREHGMSRSSPTSEPVVKFEYD
jgi:hypothetical protein